MPKKAFTPPTFEELEAYCKEKGFEHLAKQIYDYYVEGDWHDSNGKKVINWKQKLCGVWFKESNRSNAQQQLSKPTKLDLLMQSSKGADKYLDQMFPNE